MGLRRKTETDRKATQPKDSQSLSAPAFHPSSHYHQDRDVELDAIERLKANIMMLDDLQSRLSFMNREIESIIGSKKR